MQESTIAGLAVLSEQVSRLTFTSEASSSVSAALIAATIICKTLVYIW